MKLKVITDGTPQGTRVTDETGIKVENVRYVKFEVGVDFLARATIELVLSEGDLTFDCPQNVDELLLKETK
jgi:hypothetical protein